MITAICIYSPMKIPGIRSKHGPLAPPHGRQWSAKTPDIFVLGHWRSAPQGGGDLTAGSIRVSWGRHGEGKLTHKTFKKRVPIVHIHSRRSVYLCLPVNESTVSSFQDQVYPWFRWFSHPRSEGKLGIICQGQSKIPCKWIFCWLIYRA